MSESKSNIITCETSDKIIPSAEKFPSIYVNNVRAMASVFDFKFIFGCVTGNKDNDNMIVEEKIALLMSPQHAKAFSIIIQKQLENYEKTYGTIVLEGSKKKQTKEPQSH